MSIPERENDLSKAWPDETGSDGHRLGVVSGLGRCFFATISYLSHFPGRLVRTGFNGLSTAVRRFFTGARGEAPAGKACCGVADGTNPSMEVEALLSKALARQKAESETEAAKEIDRVKSQADKKAIAYAEAIRKIKAEATEAIAAVKAEAVEKVNTYTDMIARIRADVEKKVRAHVGTADEDMPSTAITKLISEAQTKQKAKSEAEAAAAIALVRAEAKDALAKQKAQLEAEAAEAIALVKAEAEAKTREYIDTIASIRAQAEEKARTFIETVSKGKPSATVDTLFSKAVAKQGARSETRTPEQTMAYTRKAGRIKVEVEEVIARVRTAAEDAVTRIRVEAEAAIVRARTEGRTRTHTDATTQAQAEEKAKMGDERRELRVSRSTQRVTQPPATVSDGQSCVLSQLRTEDVMQEKLAWVSPDDTVGQAFARIQQSGAGYVMVGLDGALEGIVSMSDLAGAISPYLRPKFSKWRRPMDDATLQIKVKWIMSRPVYFTNPQMSLEATMRNMCHLRVRALPVVDQQGKVLGLVTVANIFRAILKFENRPYAAVLEKARPVQSASTQIREHFGTELTKVK